MTEPTLTEKQPHLAHLVAGCWANGGGLSELVAATALAQAQQGIRVSLFFLGGQREHPLVETCRKAGVQVRIFKRSQPHVLYFSWEMWRDLPHALRDVTHLYIYSCWTFPVWWGAACARKHGIPYSVAPQGCLDPVRRAYGKGRKWLAWQCFDRALLRRAAWLHATAQQEAAWMKDALGKACPPIRIIPNGVDDVAFDAVPEQPRTKTVLYLGRLHPLKGLDLLLDAWQQLNPPADWELLIVGPADGYTVPEVPQVRVLPPCYGAEKVKLLKSAAIFILPTRSENFGIVVAEALWCRTPVICTKGAPWEVLGDYWTEISAPALAKALQSLISLTPEAREAHFSPLFDTAKTAYSWQTIAHNLLP
jgi:glycosyltransferase involved in cell wall biosynthesis